MSDAMETGQAGHAAPDGAAAGAPGGIRGELDRLQRRALIVGGAAALLCALGAVLDYERFLQSYLLAFLATIALPLGSLALVLLHRLTGGSWGFAIRRLLEAAMRTLPLMALLFLPIAISVQRIYIWSRPEVLAGDPVLQAKAAYLNVDGFRLRALAYFAIWGFFAWLMNRASARLDRLPDERTESRLRGWAGPGIGLYVLAVTLASVDWAMSLEPHWFSTLYGLMFVVGQGLSTFAFAIIFSAWLAQREPFGRWLSADHFHDLGKLLFAFVMLWAYFAYSQYLIQWSGNLAEETPWYLHRSSHGWQAVAIFLFALHFFLPFGVLLLRKSKRNPRFLAKIAALLLVMRVVDLYWLILPAFHPGGFALWWTDLAAPLALGALWFAAFIHQLKGRPLLSLQDGELLMKFDGPPLESGGQLAGEATS